MLRRIILAALALLIITTAALWMLSYRTGTGLDLSYGEDDLAAVAVNCGAVSVSHFRANFKINTGWNIDGWSQPIESMRVLRRFGFVWDADEQSLIFQLFIPLILLAAAFWFFWRHRKFNPGLCPHAATTFARRRSGVRSAEQRSEIPAPSGAPRFPLGQSPVKLLLCAARSKPRESVVSHTAEGVGMSRFLIGQLILVCCFICNLSIAGTSTTTRVPDTQQAENKNFHPHQGLSSRGPLSESESTSATRPAAVGLALELNSDVPQFNGNMAAPLHGGVIADSAGSNHSAAEIGFGISILAFGSLIIYWEIRQIGSRTGWDAMSFKVVGLTLIVTASLFLIFAGFSDQQIAPAFGLFGTVTGYLLGKSTRSRRRTKKNNDARTAEKKEA